MRYARIDIRGDGSKGHNLAKAKPEPAKHETVNACAAMTVWPISLVLP